MNRSRREWYFSWLISIISHLLVALILSLIVLPEEKIESEPLIEVYLLKEEEKKIEKIEKIEKREIPKVIPKIRKYEDKLESLTQLPAGDKRRIPNIQKYKEKPALKVKEPGLPKAEETVPKGVIYPKEEKKETKPKLLDVEESVGLTALKEGKEATIALPIGKSEGKEKIVEPGSYLGELQGKEFVGVPASVSGPIATRELIYLEKFDIPHNLRNKLLPRYGKFRFWVLPSGIVDKVIIEKPFGVSTLDRLAIAALYKWRFAPIDVNYRDWGIATFKIELY